MRYIEGICDGFVYGVVITLLVVCVLKYFGIL